MATTTRPVQLDPEIGRMLEKNRDMSGLFYYKSRSLTGRTFWVGIRNEASGYLRMVFPTFGECIEWLTGREFSRKGDDGNG